MFCFSGFTESSGEPTGTRALWSRLHASVAGCDSAVVLATWDANTDAMAEAVLQLRPRAFPPRVVLVGYSWGAGWAAVNLARALARRGLVVAHLVLADPVYRHPYPWGQWRALLPWIPIRIPANVDRVTWFRQRRDWPRGHDLRADGPHTRIDPPVELSCGHRYADESPAFHAAALAAARRAW